MVKHQIVSVALTAKMLTNERSERTGAILHHNLSNQKVGTKNIPLNLAKTSE